jgi:hypothetical protein
LLTVSTAARAGFCFAVLARVRLELPARERDDVALPRDAEFDLPRDDVGLPRDVEFDRPRDVDFDFPRDVDELARVRFVRVPVARPSDPLREAPLVPPLLPDRDLADLDEPLRLAVLASIFLSSVWTPFESYVPSGCTT